MYDCLGIKVFPWKLCQSKNGVCDESPPKRWTVAETFAWRLRFTMALGLTHLPRRCIYASVNWVNIGPDNGWSPDRRQTIIWTNAQLLSIRPIGTNFIQENASESVVRKMAAILSRPKCEWTMSGRSLKISFCLVWSWLYLIYAIREQCESLAPKTLPRSPVLFE